MCVQNLVPIGPQATTCVPSEGYTHTHRQTHTHTLLYRYRFILVYVSGFLTNEAAKINISPSLSSSCGISRSLLTFSSDRGLPYKFSSFIKHINFMLIRLILRKKIVNIVFCNAQKVQKIAVKVHQCPDV